MPREIGYKAQHGYTTSVDFDEGMCYRQISEEMTRRGMKMNVSGARHILVDALDKIAREVCNVYGLQPDTVTLRKIARDPRFHEGIYEILKNDE